jgi:YHS domain-containing protein
VIRLIVWLVLASLVLRSIIRLLRGIAEGLQGPPAPKLPPSVPLVRDPVCGTYVVPSDALSAGVGAQMKFFCSEKCRRAYAPNKIAQ